MKYKTGLSLVETILYVAILGMFLSGVILFLWNIMYSRTKVNAQLEMNQNLRFLSTRIENAIESSNSIKSLSTTDICLASNNTVYNPTRIYLDGNDLKFGWGGGSSDCSNLTYGEILNSNDVTISNLEFTNLSNLSSSNVKFLIEVSNKNGGSNVHYEIPPHSYTTSVELKAAN